MSKLSQQRALVLVVALGAGAIGIDRFVLGSGATDPAGASAASLTDVVAASQLSTPEPSGPLVQGTPTIAQQLETLKPTYADSNPGDAFGFAAARPVEKAASAENTDLKTFRETVKLHGVVLKERRSKDEVPTALGVSLHVTSIKSESKERVDERRVIKINEFVNGAELISATAKGNLSEATFLVNGQEVVLRCETKPSKNDSGTNPTN